MVSNSHSLPGHLCLQCMCCKLFSIENVTPTLESLPWHFAWQINVVESMLCHMLACMHPMFTVRLQLVPAVTELVISELLYLNYSAPEKPVYVYIKCEIQTLNVGQALGNAAMLLASGAKGKRFSLPNARIMTAPPRMNRSFGNVSNMMIKANELEYNTQTYVDFMSKFTGTYIRCCC